VQADQVNVKPALLVLSALKVHLNQPHVFKEVTVKSDKAFVKLVQLVIIALLVRSNR